MRGMSKGIIATGLVGVTSLVGACLANSCVYALNNSALDNVSVRIPVSCTMIGTLTSAHTTSIVSGQRIENIGATKINTSCNDKNGYVVYAIGSTGGTEGSNVLASTLGSASDIQTGDAAAGGSTSSWAMKLTASGTGDYTPSIVSEYTDYTSVPNQWTKVASLGAGTATGVDSAFNTTYAVYTISTQPAATYSGQVKYVMLHPSTAAQPTATLENAFALAGKQKITVTDPVTGDSGQFYKMQDMENSICSSATSVDENNSIRLVDTRDNKLYWVTKLKDGHCWMTQNLDLDLSPDTALTSNDTDLNDNSMAGAYGKDYSYDATKNVISWTPQNTTKHSATGAGTNWANSYNVAYSLDPGEWYWDGDDSTPNCNYLNASAGCAHFTQDRTNANRHLSVGNYYNWSAAIASDDSSSLTNSTYGSTSDPDAINRNPQNSICPKGWRLPTISYKGNVVNSTSEFARVNGLYNDGITNNDKKLIGSPLWFVRSGYVYYGNLNYPGSGAYYWSSTVLSSYYAYGLYFTATGVNPANGNLRYRGWSVRCVAR